MQKYSGEVAQKYEQTPAKKSLLIPSLEKHLPTVRSKSRLLDVGCGDAFFFDIARAHKYQYYGLDISTDMLNRAREEHPAGNYTLGSSLAMSRLYKDKFDVILISMLFVIFGSKEKMHKTLKEAKKLLKKNGVIIIGATHPCFDSYMRLGLFDQFDVSAKFQGYFRSAAQYFVNKKLKGSSINFENYHWTLADYLEVVRAAGLHLEKIDECPPSAKTPLRIDPEYNFNRSHYPTYLTLIIKA